MSATPFCTVGTLRELMKDLPDDQMIYGQVVAQDGSCWTMFTEFGVGRVGGVSLRLTHPQVKTLPNPDGAAQTRSDAEKRLENIRTLTTTPHESLEQFVSRVRAALYMKV